MSEQRFWEAVKRFFSSLAKLKGGLGPMWRKLEGYLLIPHELLHLLAHRLIGKPCRYRWGEPRVTSLTPLSRREELFVLLMPLVITWGISFGLYLTAFFTLVYLILPELTSPIHSYWHDVPRWHFGLLLLAMLFTWYGGVSTHDILMASRLLFGAHRAQERRH